MKGRLKDIWSRLNAENVGKEDYWWIALQNRAFYEDMEPLVRKWVQGSVLDLGAGRLAWRSLISEAADACLSVDLAKHHPDLDALADATSTLPFRDESFDVVFCCSVLEHAPEPWTAFSEIFRVLKPGGTAIISLPFVLHLHDAPLDFYRFTRFGVERLALASGFHIEEIVVNGGLFHLVLNVPSVVTAVAWEAIGVKSLTRPTTRLFLAAARFLDKIFGLREPFASNHIAVLRKPCSSHA
jgi:SAM-dependent methyltransferase